MFLLKKPSWLEFVQDIYDPEISKAARKQVRQTHSKSNTKIIKMKDGRLFIKVGKDLFFLKQVSLSCPYRMLLRKDEIYQHVSDIVLKCFITNTDI